MTATSPFRYNESISRRQSSSNGRNSDTSPQCWTCCYYLCLGCSLFSNLLQRIGSEIIDGLITHKERVRKLFRRLLLCHDKDLLHADADDHVQEMNSSVGVKTSTTSESVTDANSSTVSGVNKNKNGDRKLPVTPQKKSVLLTSDTRYITGKMQQLNLIRLDNEPWYQDVNRFKAEETLHKCGVEGCFLVRPSSSPTNIATLSLLYKGRVFNIAISQRSDGMLALGSEKAEEQKFADVKSLIEKYHYEELKLWTNQVLMGETVLTISPPSENSI